MKNHFFLLVIFGLSFISSAAFAADGASSELKIDKEKYVGLLFAPDCRAQYQDLVDTIIALYDKENPAYFGHYIQLLHGLEKDLLACCRCIEKGCSAATLPFDALPQIAAVLKAPLYVLGGDKLYFFMIHRFGRVLTQAKILAHSSELIEPLEAFMNVLWYAANLTHGTGRLFATLGRGPGGAESVAASIDFLEAQVIGGQIGVEELFQVISDAESVPHPRSQSERKGRLEEAEKLLEASVLLVTQASASPDGGLWQASSGQEAAFLFTSAPVPAYQAQAAAINSDLEALDMAGLKSFLDLLDQLVVDIKKCRDLVMVGREAEIPLETIGLVAQVFQRLFLKIRTPKAYFFVAARCCVLFDLLNRTEIRKKAPIHLKSLKGMCAVLWNAAVLGRGVKGVYSTYAKHCGGIAVFIQKCRVFEQRLQAGTLTYAGFLKEVDALEAGTAAKKKAEKKRSRRALSDAKPASRLVVEAVCAPVPATDFDGMLQSALIAPWFDYLDPDAAVSGLDGEVLSESGDISEDGGDFGLSEDDL